MSVVAWDREVHAEAMRGAVFAFSLSGGKDSTAAAEAAMRQLDLWGHPLNRRVAIHADLGRAEWRATAGTVEAVAARLGVRLMVVRHRSHDMVSRWEARFENGKRRYEALDVFNLIGPWSSSSLRFCTSEMKQQVIAPALLREFPGQRIVSVVGIRRDESLKRSTAPVSKREPQWSRKNGSRMLTWHPVVDWTAGQVFDRHAEAQLPLHEGYTVYGSGRLSCAFCVMQSIPDQKAAASAASNHDLFRHLVEMEIGSTFSFQPSRWLADAAPQLLGSCQRERLAQAKAQAQERRALEAALPAGLRYVKGWPLRAPTWGEAIDVANARQAILGHHGLKNRFPGPGPIVDRFEELLRVKAERLAA